MRIRKANILEGLIVVVIVILCLLFSGCGRDTKAPTIPVKVKVFNSTETSVTVIWNPSNDYKGVLGYTVFRNGEYYLQTSFMGFVDSGLDAGFIYCYQISSYDVAGNHSGFSPMVCGSTLDAAL